MASKAFFSIEFQGGAELIRELSAVELELKKVQDQIKAAQKAGDGDAYKNLRVQQEDLKRSSAELRKEIKAQATAFEKAQFPKDSLIGLEQQYSKLRAEIRGFSKDYRESAAGIAKIRLADSLKGQILDIDNSIKDFKSNIGNYKSGLSSLSNVGDIITGGLVTGGITAAIGAVISLGSSVIQTGAAFEKTKVSFENAFGDKQLAEDYVSLIQNFAATTPFEFDKLTESVLKLTNRGFTPTRAELTKLGDLAATTGKDFDQLTEAVLDAQTGEFERLKEFGIRATKANGEVTLSFKGQTKVVKDNEEAIRSAIIGLGELEGVKGAIEGQAKTFNGVFSNLKDTISQISIQIFQVFGPPLVKVIKFVGEAVQFVFDAVQPLGAKLGELFNQIFQGSSAGEAFGKVWEYVKVAISAVVSVIGTLIDYTSSTIAFMRQLGQDVPLVGKAFEFIRGAVANFVETITDIPAYIAAAAKGLSQFVQNVRNLDFSTSVIETTKKEFDAVRNLRKEAANKEAKDAETEAKLLAKRKEDADKAADAARKVQTDKQKADAKKLGEDLAKERTEQEKRLQDITAKLAELSNKAIKNDFDKLIAEANTKFNNDLSKIESNQKRLDAKVKLQGGKETKNDVLESEAIKAETVAIKAALKEQVDAIEAKRQQAYDAANEQLAKAQAENLKIVQDANAKAAKASIDNINAEAEIRIAEINGRYEKEISALADSLENRNITQEQYDKALAGIEANRSEEVLDAEKSLSESRLLLYKQYLQAKLALVDAGAQAELVSLDIAVDKEKEALTKKLADGLIQEKQYRDQLSEIDKNYAAKQKAIEADATNEKKALNNAFTKQVIDNNGKQAESTTTKTQKDIDAEKESAEIRKAIIDGSLQLAGELSDALFGAAQDNADREKEAKLKSLDDEYEKKFEAAKGNATLEAGLKKQLEEEKNAIEKKAFEENKKRQIAQAIINGALAITNVLATVPLVDFGIARAIQIAVTAASTAIQVATIKNAKFARGGFTGIGHGAPDETGHVPVGVVHANEWVANPEMVRDNPELFQRLEFEQATKYRRATHKKLFADGGFTSAIPDVIGINKVAQQKQSAAVFSNEQIDAIADRLANKTYEAVKAGSMEGTKDGVYTGQNEVNRLRERQDVLAANSTF